MNYVSANMQSASGTTHLSGIYVEIIEQPSSAGVRFRYKCEGRSAGCIRGANSSEKLKTYPTVKLHGYQGEACCVVSCVTKDGPPYYPHPHNLVGKQTNGHGVCYKPFDVNDMICSFPNLGIQCVKKKDIRESLMQRQHFQVDPFGTGFSHCNQPNKINLNVVRLCFQVIIADNSGKLSILLPPVISDPIYDNKAVSDLTILKLSHYSSPVTGGQEIILLCDQVNKDDIQVVFYEEKDDEVIWSSNGQFSPHHVHRKAAICFKSPAYRSLTISEAVVVSIQLRRPSDAAVGKPRKFTYFPLKYDPNGMIRRKLKFDNIKQEVVSLAAGNGSQDFTSRNIKRAVRKKTRNDGLLLHISGENPSNIGMQQYPAASDPQDFDISKYSPVSPCGSTSSSQPMSSPFQAAAGMDTSSCGGDILAMAARQIGASLPANNGISETDSLERLSGLDLGFDSKDLNINLSEINLDSFNDPSSLSLSFSSIEIK